MPKIIDPKKYDEVLEYLNKELQQGLNIKYGWDKEYEIRKDKKEHNIQETKLEYEKDCNEWLNRTANYVQANLDTHYYYHLTEPERGLSLHFSHPLGLISHNFDKFMRGLEEIIVRLEEQRNLKVRQEIAEKEYEADVLYKVTYSDHTREVKVNNIVLTKTDFDSENDNVFKFIYTNANRPISLEEIEQTINFKPTKRLAHIVRDLGFTNDLKTIFFPVTKKDVIEFKNPITKAYYYKHQLPPLNFTKIGRQSKTK